MSLQQTALREFDRRFEAAPTFSVRAPGRVNLIGEHTDYNDGFVMPMAIDRAVWIVLHPRDDRRVVAHSADLDQTIDFSLDQLGERSSGWGEYIKGVAWALADAGYRLQGWEGVVTGDVPIGAGLSSSAALEMATTRAFEAVSGFTWEAAEMAKLGQRAENQWVGVNCGIMDQLISAAAVDGHATLIDCRSLKLSPVPLPPDAAVVILDTTTRRGLVDSVYNERRAQCEEAARVLGISALRDISLRQFRARASELDPVVLRRARHVVTENARTLGAADAMRQGDAALLGRLMAASHTSLRDDYQVSSNELNAIVDCAWREKNCYGARMTGAGLGGCAVALVRADAADLFVAAVSRCYRNKTGLQPNVYVSHPTAGAQVEAIA